jgi:hypothetical protein
MSIVGGSREEQVRRPKPRAIIIWASSRTPNSGQQGSKVTRQYGRGSKTTR